MCLNIFSSYYGSLSVLLYCIYVVNELCRSVENKIILGIPDN